MTVETTALFWLVATQFLLYAAGWSLAALFLREHRAAALHWALFLLAMGLGFGLVGTRDETRGWAAFVGSAMCFVAGFAALARGLECFFDTPRRDAEQALTLLAVAVVLGVLGPGREHAAWRVVCAYGVGGWLCARAVVALYRHLRVQYPLSRLLLLVSPALGVIALALERVVRQLLDPSRLLELQRPDITNHGILYAYLLGAAMFNVSFAALLVMRMLDHLRHQSLTDPLTGLLNRRALEEQLDAAIRRARRNGRGLALLALDLDHFKRVNDAHGHPAGDAVLVEVARRLKATARTTDAVARSGGEEFIVLMPETPEGGAQVAAERLRAAIAAQPIALPAAPGALAMTVSIGIALHAPQEDDAVSLMQRADRALYRAKSDGRDRVVL